MTTHPVTTAPPDPAPTPCPHRTPAAPTTRAVLARLPHELRFRPRDCVLAVAVRGRDEGAGLIARIGMPDLLCPTGPELLGRLAGHLRADGAREVVVVVCCDDPDPRDAGCGLRADPAATAVRAAAVACAALAEVGPLRVSLVTGDRYLGLGCEDPACCPPGGRLLADLGSPDGWAPGVVLDSRAEVGAIGRAAAGRRRSAAAARSRWADGGRRADGAADALAWRQRSLATWRAGLAAALDAGPDAVADLAPAQLGRIEAALDDPTVRDAVVLTLVAQDRELADALLRHPTAAAEEPGVDDVLVPAPVPAAGASAPGGAPAPAPEGEAWREEAAAVSAGVRRALDVLVEPAVARPPDEAVADAARALLEAVVAHGRSGRQAPALTLLALLAWWLGDGVRAAVLTERALAHDPAHRLAELLDRALAVGLRPGWVRRRC